MVLVGVDLVVALLLKKAIVKVREPKMPKLEGGETKLLFGKYGPRTAQRSLPPEKPNTKLGPTEIPKNSRPKNASTQDAIRARVNANITNSKAARNASNFEVHIARTDQVRWGYAADDWNLKELKVGDRVIGGLPGQSSYYTSAATLEASDGSRSALFQSLQVKAHPEFGYRPKVGEYEVVKDMTVPFGTVKANPGLGAGGGDQFFINDFQTSLRLIREIPLKP